MLVRVHACPLLQDTRHPINTSSVRRKLLMYRWSPAGRLVAA
jgi:hypothetical protein